MFCQTAGGEKLHGSHYAGYGREFCNTCHCSEGKEVCTERNCAVRHSRFKRCDTTTCRYGAKFTGDNTVYSWADALAKFGASWKSLDHEMATLVRHDPTDKSGAKFTCGHRVESDECLCYCSHNASDSHQIWHHAKKWGRDDGTRTSAGCLCQDSWQWGGRTFSGCQNPVHSAAKLQDGYRKHSWCKIVPGSCDMDGYTDRVPAGSDWDTCGPQSHTLINVPDRLIPGKRLR